MKVLLDDERIAVQVGWTIVRNAIDFELLVREHHFDIEVISFDHDLDETSRSGKWCIEWLINYMIDQPRWFPNLKEIIAHSANTDGRRNIYLYALNAVDFVTAMRDVKITDLSATTEEGKKHVIMPVDFDYKSRD